MIVADSRRNASQEVVSSPKRYLYYCGHTNHSPYANPRINLWAVLSGAIQLSALLQLTRCPQGPRTARHKRWSYSESGWRSMVVGAFGSGVLWEIMLLERHISTPQIVSHLQNFLLGQFPNKKRVMGGNHGIGTSLQRWHLLRPWQWRRCHDVCKTPPQRDICVI